jgi:hypothetical protein
MPPATPPSHRALIATLQARFDAHPWRHVGCSWTDVLARLSSMPQALDTLAAMETSGGEPDVIGREDSSGRVIVCDCAAESPSGRRSLCYDDDALAARKEQRPSGSAVASAVAMRAALLTEDEYRQLQQLGEFDRKTSSWLATPADVRSRGGALFGDRRYGRVFVYHNGAQSYYAARGFRCVVRV